MTGGTDSPAPDALLILSDTLRRFSAERDWDQFHTPKNLAIALSVEAAELLEHFQWISDENSMRLTPEQMEKVREEMADVLLYLVRLADKLNVDIIQAATLKIERNAEKYPADKARANSKKYTEL